MADEPFLPAMWRRIIATSLLVAFLAPTASACSPTEMYGDPLTWPEGYAEMAQEEADAAADAPSVPYGALPGPIGVPDGPAPTSTPEAPELPEPVTWFYDPVVEALRPGLDHIPGQPV